MPTQRHGTEKMCEGTQYPFAWWQRFVFRILAEVWQRGVMRSLLSGTKGDYRRGKTVGLR